MDMESICGLLVSCSIICSIGLFLSVFFSSFSEVNPFIDDLQEKRSQLIDQAKNFSYKKFVEKSKYKQINKCTKEMEDLFARIF